MRAGVRTSDAVIEDACQVAWTRLICHGGQVALPSAPGWLARTAVHEAFRLTWREQRESSLELLVEESPGLLPPLVEPGPEDVAASHERLRGVQTLPGRQQRLLWLQALGLSYDEVASHEACSYRTVERQLARARRRLRALESEQGDRQLAA